MELRTERTSRQHRDSRNKVWTRIATVLIIVEVLLIVYLGYLLWTNGVISTSKWSVIGIVSVALILSVQLLLLLLKKLRKLLVVVTILIIGVFGFTTYRFQQVVGLFQQLNQSQNVTEMTMSVVVLKNSNIKTLEDAAKHTVLAPTSADGENIKSLIDEVKKDKNITLKTEETTSYHQAYDDLKNGKTKVIVLNSTYESLLTQDDPQFANSIEKIYEFKITKKATVRTAKTTDQKTDVFNVYISGIDTYGPITQVSRSDVNIIATVNTKTKQILLTSTPRDAYVKIADGGNNQYDKLTHAGIYGVDASMHTLENLYGIKMDYFVRVNFTTFMNLIDVVGGVDVNNEYYFKSTTVVGKEFKAGPLHLNAEYALAYVRERYNLKDGDVGRAAHQEEVITQVLKKLLSTKLLTDSDAIIQQLAQSAQTDMTLNTVAVVANKLTESSSSVNIHSQALDVEGKIGLKSYAMPNAQLWMGVVQEDSLNYIKKSIKGVIEGKTIDEIKSETTTDKSTKSTTTTTTTKKAR